MLPGVPERLRQLSRDGHLLGLITGNGDGAAFVKLVARRPDALVLVRRLRDRPAWSGPTSSGERSSAARRRSAPTCPNSEIFVIGDTPLDIEAAHAVDCTAIAVATGHYDAEALREAGADHVLETLEEELPLLRYVTNALLTSLGGDQTCTHPIRRARADARRCTTSSRPRAARAAARRAIPRPTASRSLSTTCSSRSRPGRARTASSPSWPASRPPPPRGWWTACSQRGLRHARSRTRSTAARS